MTGFFFGDIHRSFLLIETKDKEGNLKRLIYPFVLNEMTLREDYEARFNIWEPEPTTVYHGCGTRIAIEGYISDGIDYSYPVPTTDTPEIEQRPSITNGEEEIIEGEIVEEDYKFSDGIDENFEDWYYESKE